MNAIRSFPLGVHSKLGEYVYALRDPRDNHIFYIGKGNDDRLFEHFVEADKALAGAMAWTEKLRRIAEVWQQNLDVEWWIIRYNLGGGVIPPVDVFDVEAALIDLLAISKNGPALNDIAGHRGATRGILSSEDVSALAAQPVNPPSGYPSVFVFPIQNALNKGTPVYEATRGQWAVAAKARNLETPLAVGIAGGLSKGVFEITAWTELPDVDKWEFSGTDLTANHCLSNKNWLAVIDAGMGYWQYGNYLIVEFNGTGQFRFKRGSANKEWQAL